MKARRLRSWIPLAGLALVLVVILAFLYERTQGDGASAYFENVSLLRQLKQMDARWELDVLKARMGINTSYDALVDPLVILNQLQQQLRNVAMARQQAGSDELMLGTEAFHRAIEEKTRLIENFKSHNSVLRNSLAFLPTAALEGQAELGQSGRSGQDLRERTVVNRVLLNSMVYSHAPSDSMAAEIQSDLALLATDQRGRAAVAGDGLSIFAAHVRILLREQPVVNELLARIAAVPTAARIDDLDNLLSSEQRERGRQTQLYRSYLLVFAAALAGLFLYAAIHLIRSHTVIRRVNQELHEANTHLEHRVQERTRELQVAQSELVSTARQAGMAEIANNVLHNVGNVLNSVNVSADLVNTRLRNSKAQGLAKAVELINQNLANLGDFLTRDERGKMLPGYLAKLAAALEQEQHGMTEELKLLIKSVDHIKEIVATQQSYAGSASLIEEVQVRDLMEDALRMNASAMAWRQITVVREFAELPAQLLDKRRLLQILTNLIGNARQAMDCVRDRIHQLTLRVDTMETAAEQWLRIQVEDNGEGIHQENLSRLFVHGFTTRSGGHGFGLHSCALAAKEMGGTLTAHSDGPGRGATFTLQLPINQAQGTP